MHERHKHCTQKQMSITTQTVTPGTHSVTPGESRCSGHPPTGRSRGPSRRRTSEAARGACTAGAPRTFGSTQTSSPHSSHQTHRRPHAHTRPRAHTRIVRGGQGQAELSLETARHSTPRQKEGWGAPARRRRSCCDGRSLEQPPRARPRGSGRTCHHRRRRRSHRAGPRRSCRSRGSQRDPGPGLAGPRSGQEPARRMPGGTGALRRPAAAGRCWRRRRGRAPRAPGARGRRRRRRSPSPTQSRRWSRSRSQGPSRPGTASAGRRPGRVACRRAP